MIKTIAIPCLLFIWFIIAFIWDGNSFKNLRARYTPYHVEHFSQPMQAKPHTPAAPLQESKNLSGEDTQH